MTSPRAKPNFLVTGTPGVGKTTFSAMLAEKFSLLHVPVSRLIADEHLWVERDDERNCTIYDDTLLDQKIDEIINSHPHGGIVFDFHDISPFPINAIDIVLVLRCSNDVLYPRLKSRGYSDQKITENIDAEIFQVILDEAEEAFPPGKVVELQSETTEQLDEALSTAGEFIAQFNQ